VRFVMDVSWCAAPFAPGDTLGETRRGPEA